MSAAAAARDALPASAPDDSAARARCRFLQRAGKALAQGDAAAARRLAETHAARHPDTVDAPFVAALAAFLEADLAEAASLAVAAVDADPSSREPADLAAVLFGLAGDLGSCAYYGKLASLLAADPERAAVVPPSLPELPFVLCTIAEQPLLRRGSQALAEGRPDAAERWLRQHLYFESGCRDAYRLLAAALLAQGRIRAAADLLRGARQQFPEDAAFASLMARVLALGGQFARANACHRQAQALAPDDPVIHAAALADRLADPDCAAPKAAACVRAWAARFGAPKAEPGAPAVRQTDRPLHVGLLVGNAAGTPEAAGLTELLLHRDGSRARITAFGCGRLGAAANIAFQKAVDNWCDIADADPLTLAAVVRGQGIDILVDLCGFDAPELLPAFAGRMAPVQAAWLGAPYGTGLARVDVLLTDRFVDADAGSPPPYRERPLLLELGCVPIPIEAPAAAPLARTASDLLFAADATLADLDAITVGCWAEILRRSGGKLLLRDHDFHDPETAAELIARFGEWGMAGRIDIVRAASAEAVFAEADAVLLPLSQAQPDGVAAALRAGVAPVCPAGAGRHRRFAGSLLHHLGLATETLADGPEAYVALAVGRARVCERRRLQATLAERLGGSPAADARARMRDLQAALERVWQEQGAAAGAETGA